MQTCSSALGVDSSSRPRTAAAARAASSRPRSSARSPRAGQPTAVDALRLRADADDARGRDARRRRTAGACDVSLEQVMGCGLGGCYSCVVLDRGRAAAAALRPLVPRGPGVRRRRASSGRRWRTDPWICRFPSDRSTCRTRSSRRAAASATASSTPTSWTSRRSAASSVKGLFLAEREGHPPPRIVETPAGMLNAIGLQGIGVHRFVAREAAGAARAARDRLRQHLRHDDRRVRRGRAHPVGRRGRRGHRAEHLLPEHQGRRHHVRLQPDRHPRRRQRGAQGHAAAGHSEADART